MQLDIFVSGSFEVLYMRLKITCVTASVYKLSAFKVKVNNF